MSFAILVWNELEATDALTIKGLKITLIAMVCANTNTKKISAQTIT
jgi:hypothetical protein